MTRKRRMTKPAPAPVATSALGPPAYSPARSTRSAASSVLSLLTPPTRAKSSSSSSSSAFADLPVLSPPLKKRVHTRSDARAVKVQSLEEALDEQDEYDDQQRFVDGDGYGDSQSNTSNSNTQRHNIKPDPHLPDPYKRAAKVLHYKGSVYDAMLTRARVHQNQCEFIALQALEYENQFYLWTRSGSIGYTGKTLLMGPYECEERIIMEFCMVFSSKTSCTWEERHSLQYQEGSFTWIELDYSMGTPYSDLSSSLLDSGDDYEDPGSSSRTGQKRRRNSRSSSSSSSSSSTRQYNFVQDWNSSSSSNAAALSANKRAATAAALCPPASRLHAEVQAFLNLIADPHEYHSYNYSETEEVMEEAQKMPLGRLSKTTIKRGYETLQQIYEALRTRTACRTRISNLSSHFYSIIPHHSRLDVIDTMVKLGKKVAMMESVCGNVRGMSAMEVVNACKQRNYLDECYALLGCDMLPVSENSDEYAFVKAYLKNSSCCGWKDGTLQLLNVFRVYKPDEDDRFEPYRDFPNRRILWHGSRMSNWLGILTDGLRIAPPEVASNGRIFGKGIYFTDKASKAQAYCHASARHGGSQNKCVFVLSEVALGDVKEMVSSDENAKRWVHVSCGGHTKASAFNSCKGVGTCRPDASGDVADKDGAVWPLGKPVQTAEATGLSHSEYIIYNPAQARMRYVVVAKSAY